MSFLENIKEFFSLAKQTNYDFAQIHSQNPDSIYTVGGILVVILLIIVFLIRRSMKISSTVKLVSQIQNSSDYDDYNNKLTKLATELPKRGKKVVDSMNLQKNDILNKELALLKDYNISDKIDKYKQISAQYALISQNSKKFNNNEFTSYYENTSKTLLDENLVNEIEAYYNEARFTLEDVPYVNSIVAFANSRDNAEELINPLLAQINSFSYGYNLDLFKFTMALTKNESKQVYTNCTERIHFLLNSEDEKVSEVILSYMLENELNEDVYTYISNLKNATHLQTLHDTMFAKKDDIDLDLAFVANETMITCDYADHIDREITSNWRDVKYIKHIIESDRVLETIGHISYRNVLERIERLEKDEETNAAISQALEIARRAEALANEAKEIARQK